MVEMEETPWMVEMEEIRESEDEDEGIDETDELDEIDQIDEIDENAEEESAGALEFLRKVDSAPGVRRTSRRPVLRLDPNYQY